MKQETIVAAINSAFEFRHRHPVISIALSLLMVAACAGAIYLIIIKIPSIVPCFTVNGCH